MPSIDDERKDPTLALEQITSAVTWLRNNRRGDSYLILNFENASYGFRRNLYGSKALGIAICLVCLTICVAIELIAVSHSTTTLSLETIESGKPEVAIGSAISFVCLLAWWMVVTPSWVEEAANLYARALLETCDLPVTQGPQA